MNCWFISCQVEINLKVVKEINFANEHNIPITYISYEKPEDIIEKSDQNLSHHGNVQNIKKDILNLNDMINNKSEKKPLCMSILMRKLNEGISYSEFRNAWLPPVENLGSYFDIPVLVINGHNVTDPTEIVSIGLIWSDVEEAIETYKKYQHTEDARQEKIEKISANSHATRFCKILNIDILGDK